MMKTIAAAQFKGMCLKLMDEVAATGEALVVTKRGKALVRLVPATAEAKPRTIFGAARDTILFLAPDDELLSTGAKWNAAR